MHLSSQVARFPKCVLLHLAGAPRVGPGQGPDDYEGGGGTDLEWVVDDDGTAGGGGGNDGGVGAGGAGRSTDPPVPCAVAHYTTAEARRCFAAHNISDVFASGDSVGVPVPRGGGGAFLARDFCSDKLKRRSQCARLQSFESIELGVVMACALLCAFLGAPCNCPRAASHIAAVFRSWAASSRRSSSS